MRDLIAAVVEACAKVADERAAAYRAESAESTHSWALAGETALAALALSLRSPEFMATLAAALPRANAGGPVKETVIDEINGMRQTVSIDEQGEARICWRHGDGWLADAMHLSTGARARLVALLSPPVVAHPPVTIPAEPARCGRWIEETGAPCRAESPCAEHPPRVIVVAPPPEPASEPRRCACGAVLNLKGQTECADCIDRKLRNEPRPLTDAEVEEVSAAGDRAIGQMRGLAKVVRDYEIADIRRVARGEGQAVRDEDQWTPRRVAAWERAIAEIRARDNANPGRAPGRLPEDA